MSNNNERDEESIILESELESELENEEDTGSVVGKFKDEYVDGQKPFIGLRPIAYNYTDASTQSEEETNEQGEDCDMGEIIYMVSSQFIWYHN
jgi:hypothetical protein